MSTTTTNVKDLHVREMAPLPSPGALRDALPASAGATNTVTRSRQTIRRILRGEDERLLVIVGPCSIHDPDAALDYAQRLRAASERFSDRLLLVMRTYFEKPRTTIGWRGLVNDPHLDGSFDMATGLFLARRLMATITDMGLPVATEMLDPITPQYFADLVSFAAIGARTTESQTHRALASGLSMPVGFKNGTDGGVQVAADALVSAGHPHSFLGVGDDGQCCVVKTDGNPDTVIILRGGKGVGPNYDAGSVQSAAEQVRRANAGREPALLVDCSHANSGYDPCAQKEVWRSVVGQRANNSRALVGLMAESNLVAGKQPLGPDPALLRYGVSVTDACLGWDDTLTLLEEAYETLGGEQSAPARLFSLARGENAAATAATVTPAGRV